MTNNNEVRIKVRGVGHSFGCIGVVLDEKRRVIAQTAVYPYGFSQSARSAAEALCKDAGWRIL